VITSGYDGAVGLFNLETRKAELLGYHDHLVNRVTVNREGTKAATASSDYTIYIWDLQGRRVEQVLKGHYDDAEDFVFIDEKRGASVSRDWRVLVWNLEHGNILHVIDGHEKDVLSISYMNGKLFTSGDDMTLRVWDLETGKELDKWGPFETETDTCAIDPIHGRAVLGCDDGVIRVFDIQTGETLREIEAHNAGIKKVAVSPANGDILSAAYDQKILIWDAEDFRQKIRLQSKCTVWERSFNWSPDGKQVVAGTFDGTVLVWDAAEGQCIAEIGEQATEPGNACFNDISANQKGDIALVSDDGFVRTATLTPDQAEWLTKVEPASGRMLMNAVTLDERRNRVITGSHDQKLHIYDNIEGKLQNELEVFLGEGPINCIRVSEQVGFEGWAFIACYKGTILGVSPDGQIRSRIHVHENAVKALRIHPHLPIGVSCSADGILVSWALGGERIRLFPGHTAIIDDVDIEPAGDRVVSVGRDFVLKVHRIDNGEILHAVSLGKRSPKGVCFFDDSTVIVTNYWGELIKVTLPDEQVLRRQISGNGISAICRSGKYIAVSCYEGAVFLVRPEDLQVVRTLRAMTQRVD
jgi:WD40 repeat protein